MGTLKKDHVVKLRNNDNVPEQDGLWVITHVNYDLQMFVAYRRSLEEPKKFEILNFKDVYEILEELRYGE